MRKNRYFIVEIDKDPNLATQSSNDVRVIDNYKPDSYTMCVCASKADAVKIALALNARDREEKVRRQALAQRKRADIVARSSPFRF